MRHCTKPAAWLWLTQDVVWLGEGRSRQNGGRHRIARARQAERRNDQARAINGGELSAERRGNTPTIQRGCSSSTTTTKAVWVRTGAQELEAEWKMTGARTGGAHKREVATH